MGFILTLSGLLQHVEPTEPPKPPLRAQFTWFRDGQMHLLGSSANVLVIFVDINGIEFNKIK